MTTTLLIAEDDPVQRRMLASLLTRKLGYEVMQAADGEEAIARVQASSVGEISAVLLDVQMPKMNGFEVLQALRKYRPDLPVLMLTSSDDTEIAVRAIKEGASDFIVKPADPTHLNVAIENAIRLSTLARELAKMKRDKEGAVAFADLIGHHGGLREAVAYGRKAAAAAVPVLITGESGVGKELFARAIHGESKRVTAPFIAINCALPETLVESTLFSPDKGVFRRAEGGSVFLDDIDRLPAEAQVRLLRLLQSRDIEQAAGAKPVRVNVRVIAASERDLSRAVAEGKFREDLYFRLGILTIHLAPLRERPQDIVPMATYFIERLSETESLPKKALSPSAQEYLMAQAWSGNVRELENLIHRAMVLADDVEIDSALLERIHAHTSTAPTMERRTTPALHINLRHPDGQFKSMAEIETETLRAVLAHYETSVSHAADALQIARSTFYRKIKDAK